MIIMSTSVTLKQDFDRLDGTSAQCLRSTQDLRTVLYCPPQKVNTVVPLLQLSVLQD